MVYSPADVKEKQKKRDERWNKALMESACRHIDSELSRGDFNLDAYMGFIVHDYSWISRLDYLPVLVRDSVIVAFEKQGWNIEIKRWTEGWLFRKDYCAWVFSVKEEGKK